VGPPISWQRSTGIRRTREVKENPENTIQTEVRCIPGNHPRKKSIGASEDLTIYEESRLKRRALVNDNILLSSKPRSEQGKQSTGGN